MSEEMNNGSGGEEEEQTQMLMRAMTEKNVKKIETALAKTKKHGKGFVLSSHFYKPKPRQLSPKNKPHPVQPRMPIVIGSPIGSPLPSRGHTSTQPSKRTRSAETRRVSRVKEEPPRPQSAYITEYIPPPLKIDMAIQSDEAEEKLPMSPPASPDVSSEEEERENEEEEPVEEQEPFQEEQNVLANEDLLQDEENVIPQQNPSSPVQRDDPVGEVMRDDPVGEVMREGPIGEDPTAISGEERRISYPNFKRLGLSKRPSQFQYQIVMPPTNVERDPENPEPIHPYIWVTKVSKSGGDINSPFYMQLHLPEGALRGDVIMKFETQSYKNSKLGLDETDKLCSNIIDVDMSPLAYCLHRDATVKLRILEKCINKFDDITIVNTRHFSWRRKPTTIETDVVNGNKLYYAVTKTQSLGKFAVVTTRRRDRFVMTTAGGKFQSTSLPEVGIRVKEGALADMAHLVEVSMHETLQDTIEMTKEGIDRVKDVEGTLVACSPLVNVTKDIMGKSGLLEDGVVLPNKVEVTVPVMTFAKPTGNPKTPWIKPTIKVMRKTDPSGWKSMDEQGDTSPAVWEDITKENKVSVEPLFIQGGAGVPIETIAPCHLVVLVFEANKPPENSNETDISEMCEKLQEMNSMFQVRILVHQKVEVPEIINIHIIPASAAEVICEAMKRDNEWEMLGGPSTGVRLKERERLTMRFRGSIQLTINQMEPEILFHSRRWQGHQFQIEATDEGFATCNSDVIGGMVEFVKDDDEPAYNVTLSLPRQRAKPYHPTTVVKPIPKVSVFREYKLKWLKSLSAAEKEKYKSINSP